MPVQTRSRRLREGLGPIPEHEPVKGTNARASRKPPVARSKRETTPGIGQIPIPQTPNTTDQAMLDELARGMAPKKPRAKALERAGEDERIGQHHGHRIFTQGSESFLQTMPRSQVPQFMQQMMEKDNVESEQEIRDREMQVLRQQKKRVDRMYLGLPQGVQGLGPEGTWQMEESSQVCTTNEAPRVNYPLGPSGTYLVDNK